jgi:hypothetical protein
MKKRIYSFVLACLFFSTGLLQAQHRIQVVPGDDLIAKVAAAADKDTLVLAPGFYKANYTSMIVNKSLAIISEDLADMPKVYLKKFELKGSNISFHLEGIEFSGFFVDSLTHVERIDTVPAADYLIDLTTEFVSGKDIVVKSCIVRNLNRSVVRGDRLAYTVENFLFDDLIVYDLRGGGDYGPFRMKSNIKFNTFTLRNSTMYNMLNKLIDLQDIPDYPMDVTVENCTFYKWGGGKTGNFLFDIKTNTQASLYLRNNIFGKTNASETVIVNGFRVPVAAYMEITTSVFTPDFVVKDSAYEVVSWDKKEYVETNVDPEWADPDNGNFTLPDNSPLLQMSTEGGIIGDPRWNPVTRADADLGSIILSAGTLTPAFSPSVTSYTLHVPEGTTEVTITGKGHNPRAKVTGGGTISEFPGQVTLIVTAEDGSTKSYTISVWLTGVKETLSTIEMLYPNPARNTIYITARQNDFMSIYNTLGQKVRTIKLEQGINTVDIFSLESGVYIIRSETTPGKAFKFMVK